MIPKKSDVIIHKISLPPKESSATEKAKPVQIFCVDDEPLFFDMKPPTFEDLYPTLYALWKVPKILKPITIHAAVSQFVLNGAGTQKHFFEQFFFKTLLMRIDLMLPGVAVPKEGLQTFNRHEKRCVLVEGNAKAICLGRLAISSADAIRKSMKGKAMRVFHYFNDYCMLFFKNVVFVKHTNSVSLGFKNCS